MNNTELYVQAANLLVDSWSDEELKQFAFDRLATELVNRYNETNKTGQVVHDNLIIDLDAKQIFKRII
jgi:hypothetical protein